MYKLIAFRSEFRTLNLIVFKSGQNPVWTPKVAKTLWDSNSITKLHHVAYSVPRGTIDI